MEFNQVQFRGYHNPNTNDGYVEAHVNGDDIGALTYQTLESKHPTITVVDVDPEHQRKGVATEMYKRAMEQTGGQLQHSAYRTTSGDAFAHKMGGVIPDRVPVPDV